MGSEGSSSSDSGVRLRSESSPGRSCFFYSLWSHLGRKLGSNFFKVRSLCLFTVVVLGFRGF